MGHHRFGSGGHYSGSSPYGLLAGMPRGIKIFLILLALFLVLVVVAVGIIVILLVLKLLSGGTLPALLQNALDFARQNLQPLLDLWKTVQGLSGK